MTDYANTCDKGCKYSRPNLVAVKKLNYKSTSNRWYTWSHISNTLKDVKFFTEVSLQRGADGQFVANNRQLDESDASLIKALEAKTGLSHSPAFDAGNTRTTTSKTKDGKTKVAQVVTLRASGMVAMWPGKIREGIRESVATTFKNIGP